MTLVSAGADSLVVCTVDTPEPMLVTIIAVCTFVVENPPIFEASELKVAVASDCDESSVELTLAVNVLQREAAAAVCCTALLTRAVRKLIDTKLVSGKNTLITRINSAGPKSAI